ncbi:MAG: hypothetical protein OK474_00595 [Thaumarchaeota archaeon]|nr:hypothetical protein [Nitrososphaerota archaeon]
MPSTKLSNDQILQAMHTSMARSLGEVSLAGMDFFADPHVALENPTEYTRMLQAVLGSGAELMLREVIDALYREAGIEPVPGSSLKDCMNTIRPR